MDLEEPVGLPLPRGWCQAGPAGLASGREHQCREPSEHPLSPAFHHERGLRVGGRAGLGVRTAPGPSFQTVRRPSVCQLPKERAGGRDRATARTCSHVPLATLNEVLFSPKFSSKKSLHQAVGKT